jgi:hypothetical protein
MLATTFCKIIRKHMHYTTAGPTLAEVVADVAAVVAETAVVAVAATAAAVAAVP